MNKLAVTVSAALGLISSAQVSAWEIETTPTAYVSIPFNGNTRTEREPTLGLALGQLHKANPLQPGLALFQGGVPPLVDVQFRDGDVGAVNFNGVNTLHKHTVYAADGSTSTESDIDWAYAVPIALAVGAAIYLAQDNNNHDNHGIFGGLPTLPDLSNRPILSAAVAYVVANRFPTTAL